MKHGYSALVAALGILGLGLSLVGCAARPATRVGLFLDIDENSRERIDQGGMQVSVRAITQENYSSFPGILTDLAAETPDGPTTIPWIDVNLPAFELTILNNTGHVVTFDRAVIKLQDDHQTIYQPSTKPDLEATVDDRARELASGQVNIDAAVAKSRVRALKLAGPDLQLLPGIAKTAYCTFNYPSEPATFLTGKSYLKLMLFEIPVATNGAGDVTETTSFEFQYDIHARTVEVTR